MMWGCSKQQFNYFALMLSLGAAEKVTLPIGSYTVISYPTSNAW